MIACIGDQDGANGEGVEQAGKRVN